MTDTQVGTSSATTDWSSWVSPVKPNDGLPFDELLTTYNFENTSNLRLTFARAVIEACGRAKGPVTALDVGCGRGLGRRFEYVRAIREHVDSFWGLEPDEGVTPAEGIFDHFQHALMETAELPAEAFDVAYSYMVMEHVEDPEGFLRAVARCLKPGGEFLFVTPNGRHYFTRIAKITHALKIDEAVLRLVKGKQKDDYHYPVRYRFNTEAQIIGAAQRAGMARPDLVYVESEGPKSYLPGPLRPILRLMAVKRRMYRNPKNLLSIIGRIRKPA